MVSFRRSKMAVNDKSTPIRSGGGGGMVKKQPHLEATPPITPLSPEATPLRSHVSPQQLNMHDDPHSPVRDVHFPKRSGQTLRAQQEQQPQHPPHDEKSVVSELTYPLEMQHHHHQQQQHQQQQQQPYGFFKGNDQPSGSSTTTTTNSSPTPEEENIVTRVLGLVEMTCLNTLQEMNVVDRERRKIPKARSFAGEWGVAPTREEDDDDNIQEEYTYNTGTYNTEERTEEDPRPRLPSDDSESDFFEMVLHEEDLQLTNNKPQPKKNRRWMSFRKEQASPSPPRDSTAVLGITKRQQPEEFCHKETNAWPLEEKKEETPLPRDPPAEPTTVAKKETEKSPKRPFNPAAILIRKAKNARERKRQAEKEKRYKKLLLTLKKRSEPHNKETLTTVTEGEENNSQRSAEQVRVPGVHLEDDYVKASDLVGNDLASVEQQPWREILESKQETANPPTSTGRDPPESTVSGTSTHSAATTLLRNYSQRHVVDKQKVLKSTKPQWKEVLDAKSGRKYYYHRLTRQTTWERPPEDQIYMKPPPKTTRYTTSEIRDLLQKTPPREESKKDDITRILTQVAPTKTVDRLVSTYEGKEDELVDQLKSLTESKPFDEPVATPHLERARTCTSSSLRTGASVYSGVSGKLSEVTPQIKNTSRRRKGYVDAIEEGSADGSHSTPRNRLSADSPARSHPSIPSNIPVPHRRRELRVENLSSDRRTAETFDTGRPPRARRVLRSRTAPSYYNSPQGQQEQSSTTSSFKTNNLDPYLGDNEETDKERETDSMANSAAMEDSISALSEPEHDFRQDTVYESRRRALNDAIAREDWDLAATLSEGLRTIQNKPMRQPVQKQHEWMQSELDRFISENDWDAVAGYIAQVRRMGKRKALKSARPGGPMKRFGARSQLQHSALNSVSSWESSTSYDSEESYEEEEEYSYEDLRRLRRQKFAC